MLRSLKPLLCLSPQSGLSLIPTVVFSQLTAVSSRLTSVSSQLTLTCSVLSHHPCLSGLFTIVCSHQAALFSHHSSMSYQLTDESYHLPAFYSQLPAVSFDLIDVTFHLILTFLLSSLLRPLALLLCLLTSMLLPQCCVHSHRCCVL